MNMKKFLSCILSVAVILSCFSMVVFAADDVYFYDGTNAVTAVTATSDTYTVDIYLNPTESMKSAWIGNMQGVFDVTNGSITSAAGGTLSPLTDMTNTVNIGYYDAGDGAYEPSDAVQLAHITVAREGAAATSVVSFSSFLIGDWEGASYNEYTVGSLTITWPSAGPSVTGESAEYETSTITGTNGKTYKDVPTYGVSATVSGTATTLTFKLNVNYKKNGTPVAAPEVLDGGSVAGYISEGTVTFKAAIVGVPTDVEITGVTPVFTAN